MKILFDRQTIAGRVAELGREITSYFRGKPLTVIAVTNGAAIFASDLVRAIDLPLLFDTVSAASYSHKKSTGKVTFRSAPKLPVKDRSILIADDILDTGRTSLKLRDQLLEQGAKEVKFCVILEKDLPRPEGLAHADWAGFIIPDKFIVGYGMDYDEEYRNLPDIQYID